MKKIFRRLVSFAILIAMMTNICVVPAMAAHNHQGVMCGKKVSWYEDITSSSHTLVTAYEDICSCGEIIGTIDETRKSESHSFSGNTCTKCNYTKKSHTHSGAMCGDKVTWYDNINSETHTYYTAYENLCSCGANLGLIDQTYVIQVHSFNGDTCSKCGYTRTHTHNAVMCGQTTTWVDYSDSNGHVIATGYEDLCSCGASMGWTIVGTVSSSHSFSGDTCRECGYTRTHVHQGAMCGDFESWYEDVNSETHTYVTAYEELCSCGANLGWTDETWTVSPHSFSGDTCRECGYTRSHVHSGAMCGDFESWYEDVNSETHTYVTAYEELCSCGATLGWTDETWTVSPHSFSGDTCWECGYTRSHVHQGAMCGDFESWYEDINSDTHTHVTAYENLCSCGENLGWTDQIWTVEGHTYGNDDVCNDCGYTRNHIHQGAMCGNVVTWYGDVNEQTHTYYSAYESLCSCGEYLGTIDESSTIEPHSFSGDTCRECGYTREHVHQGAMCGREKTWYENATENAHTKVSAYEELCSCGEVVGEMERTETVEKHTFESGICTECGYYDPYYTGHVHKASQCGEGFTFYLYNNTSTHSRVVYEGDHLCSCGEKVADGEYVTYDEPHELKNDICVQCGIEIHIHTPDKKAETGKHYLYSDKNEHVIIRVSGGSYCECGEFIADSDNDITYSYEPHTFYDEKCTKCGYSTKSYLEVTGEQIIYGDFSDDANLGGVAAQIIIGEIPGVGLVADVRDLLASETPGDVFINLIGIIPLIGSLKYSDEMYVVFKHTGDVPIDSNVSDELKEIAQAVMKNGEDAKYLDNLHEVNRVADNLDEGFVDYNDFKKIYGSAGEGKEWHHIVEQSQIEKSGFDPKLINNGGNIIPIDAATHRKVSGYYKRLVPGTNMSFRDWLAYKGFSYEQQAKIGEYVLEMYGVKVK